MTKDQIIKKVKNAGVVGEGGAGFPSHLKLASKCHTVIANGAECEPLIYTDKEIMSRFPENVIQGLQIAMQATGAQKGIIALKKKYTRAIQSLETCIQNKDKDISIHLLDDFYPAGDEITLIYEILRTNVPEGGIPPDIGVLVQNVGTLRRISDSIQDKPVTSKIITINGAVKKPCIIEVPIGATLEQVIAVSGGPTLENFRILRDGPMMGSIAEDLKEVIIKTSSALIILKDSHPLIQKKSIPLDITLSRARSVCDQCRYCTDFCPRNLLGYSLEPQKIMQSVGYSSHYDEFIITGTYLCCKCGLCGNLWACPTLLTPNIYFAGISLLLKKNGISNPHIKKTLNPHEFRESRKVPTDSLLRRLGLENLSAHSPEWVDTQPGSFPEVRIPLTQHIGMKASPVVRKGDLIETGDVIASPENGKPGAQIHASIKGYISEVSSSYIKIRRE